MSAFINKKIAVLLPCFKLKVPGLQFRENVMVDMSCIDQDISRNKGNLILLGKNITQILLVFASSTERFFLILGGIKNVA